VLYPNPLREEKMSPLITRRIRKVSSGSIALACLIGAVFAAASAQAQSGAMFDQNVLPETVRVPAGNKLVMETVGVGQITYECRAKAGAMDQFEWVFVGPDAVLNDRAGRAIGKYFGPPATWESSDGSKLTATQLAVAPAGAGNIPLQLVKANPATGSGTMSGVTYIQRVATRGGVAPAAPCTATTVSSKELVKYQADYMMWKAQ
jgi:hypothetical protein